MARPSSYTAKVGAEICGRLASGDSLNTICREDKMPDVRTVYRWLEANDEFRQLYARAREDQADTLADQILAIADEDPALSIQERGGESVSVVDGAAVQHQRLRIEARKWIAAKLKPKKYGDKVDLTHGGPDGGPLVTKIVREIVRPKNPNR